MNKIRKITLLLVGLAIITVALICFILFNQKTDESMKKLNEEQLSQLADHNAYLTKREINSALNILVTATENFNHIDIMTEVEKKRILSNVCTNSPFVNITIADLNGNSVSNSGTVLNIKDKNYYKRALLGETTIEMEDEDIIISSPIIVEGKVIATLHGEYDAFNLPNNENVIDVQGMNFFEGLEEANIEENLTVSDIEEDIIRNKSNTVTFSIRDDKRIMYYTPLGVNEWYLIMNVTYSHIEDNIRPINHIVGIFNFQIAMLCVFATVIIIHVIFHYVNRKNKELTKAYIQAEKANKAKAPSYQE